MVLNSNVVHYHYLLYQQEKRAGDMSDSKDQVLSLLRHLEAEIGPISPEQRALISTDGSVTRLLEVFSSDPVGVHTLSQEIIQAPVDIASDLEITTGDEVNCRIVNLVNKRTHETLIQAISYAPLKRLPLQARQKLMKADEPIGIILRDEKMESRRELLSVRHFRQDEKPLPLNSGLKPVSLPSKNQIHISRTYRIIHNNHPIFRIEEVMPVNLFTEKKRFTIITPSRLHLGLIDMNGSTGRVDGGAGITLDDPGFEIEFSKSHTFSITAPDAAITTKISSLISRVFGSEQDYPMEIRVNRSIPFHAGLGSGTQLALALVSGVAYMNGEEISSEAIIQKTGRGGTSGIGVRAFTDGGLIVDAGHRYGEGKAKSSYSPSAASSGVKPAPLIGRYEFPKDWKIVLAIPDSLSGSQGQEEINIFQRCCPVPLDEVRTLSHLVMMKLIPSVLEQDLDEFGDAINGFSEYGFKRCELDLQPPIIRSLIRAMRESGAAGAGMSSFGPVVYGITDTDGREIQSAAEEIMQASTGGKTLITKGRNRGYEILS